MKRKKEIGCETLKRQEGKWKTKCDGQNLSKIQSAKATFITANNESVKTSSDCEVGTLILAVPRIMTKMS